MIVLIALGVLILALIVALIVQMRRFRALNQSYHALDVESRLKDAKIAQKEEEVLSLKTQLKDLSLSFDARLKGIIDSNMQNLERNLKEHYSAQEKNILTQSDNLILKTKEDLSKSSKSVMDEIFTPLKSVIDEYSKSLSKNEGAMRANVEEMLRLTGTIGKKADSLSETLRGNKKIRGDFGELQLKSVLESSGLVQGEQYFLQESAKIDGANYRPDAIVLLNDGRGVVIDAKFSLPSTLDDLSDEDKSKELAVNIKTRIQELASKPYTKIEKEGFSDIFPYAMLFIPYQALLDRALESDPGLFRYAQERNIYVVTPNTLHMGLKVISFVWINENRSKNVIEVLNAIEGFKKKLDVCAERFEDVEKKIFNTQSSFGELKRSFLDGRGNLISRIDNLESSRKKLERE